MTKTSLDVDAVLEPNEKLLWQGLPQQGFVFRKEDLFLIPLGLLWCTFVVIWVFLAVTVPLEAQQEQTEATWIFLIVGLPFFIGGYYMLIGRHQLDIWRRKKLQYAITDERAIILQTGRSSSTRSFVLSGFSNIEITERKSGRGSILFGTRSSPNWFFNPWFFLGPTASNDFEFEGIEDVKTVYNVMKSSLVKRG